MSFLTSCAILMSLCNVQFFCPGTTLCEMMVWINDLALLCSSIRALLVQALPNVVRFPWLGMKVQRDTLLCRGRLNMHPYLILCGTY